MFVAAMQHLWGEKRLSERWRDQFPALHCPQKAVQIARRDVRAAIGRADRRVRVDVLLPARDLPVCIAQRVAALRHVAIHAVHPKEIAIVHRGPGENIGPYVVAVALATGLLDQQTEQHIAHVE